MASEILRVPEENLAEVIKILRAGMVKLGKKVTEETREALTEWCDSEERYLARMAGPDEDDED